MNIREEVPKIYLKEYDVEVNQYLTYAQIQNIVNGTNKLMNTEGKNKKGETIKYNSWADMQQSIDMMVLMHATNLSETELNTPHSVFLNSGLIDGVRSCIINYDQIAEAFEYTNGTKATILSVISGLTSILKHINPKTLIKKEDNGSV